VASKEGFHPDNKVTAQFPISMRKVGESGLDAKGEPHNNVSYAYFGFDFHNKNRIDAVWTVKNQIDCIKLSPSPLVLKETMMFGLVFRKYMCVSVGSKQLVLSLQTCKMRVTRDSLSFYPQTKNAQVSLVTLI
jgi:hypothetical protein